MHVDNKSIICSSVIRIIIAGVIMALKINEPLLDLAQNFNEP